MKEKIKRLTIDLPEEDHSKIKAHAALRNQSYKLWVLRAIMKQLKEEDGYLRNESLEMEKK